VVDVLSGRGGGEDRDLGKNRCRFISKILGESGNSQSIDAKV